MAKQLELFEWTPPTAKVFVIPPARRVAEVRLCAQVMIHAKEQWRRDLYWRRQVEKFWMELRRAGLSMEEAEAAIAAFNEAVVSAMSDSTPKAPPSPRNPPVELGQILRFGGRLRG